MDSQGVPGLPHRQLGKELVVVAASGCGVGLELLGTGSGSDSIWLPTWAGTLTSDAYLATRGHEEENATQICLASFTLPPHLPVHLLPTIQSYLPTLVSRVSWTAVTEELQAPHPWILGVEDYQVADPVFFAPPPWEAVYNCCSRRTPDQALQAALVATDSPVN